jgi:hypothetical protein
MSPFFLYAETLSPWASIDLALVSPTTLWIELAAAPLNSLEGNASVRSATRLIPKNFRRIRTRQPTCR